MSLDNLCNIDAKRVMSESRKKITITGEPLISIIPSVQNREVIHST